MTIVGYRFVQPETIILTARAQERRVVEEAGLRGLVTGLPYVYLERLEVGRRPGTLLIVPRRLDSTPQQSLGRYDRNFRSFVKKTARLFSECQVLLSQEDRANSEVLSFWQSQGFMVEAAVSYRDSSSLISLKATLMGAEAVLGQPHGSWLPYALSEGCKVGIFPGSSTGQSQFRPVLVNGEERLRLDRFWVLMNRFPNLWGLPTVDSTLQSWGREEVGFAERLPPHVLRKRLGWAPRERWGDVMRAGVSQGRGGKAVVDLKFMLDERTLASSGESGSFEPL